MHSAPLTVMTIGSRSLLMVAAFGQPTRPFVLPVGRWSRHIPAGGLCRSQVILAGTVPGLLQSAHRAELLGILQSLKYAQHWGRPIRIWSDCESVVNRVRKILDFGECPKVNSPHNDLWSEVYDIAKEWSNFATFRLPR